MNITTQRTVRGLSGYLVENQPDIKCHKITSFGFGPIVGIALVAFLLPSFASAGTIFLGNDTNGPVQMFSTSGTFLGFFGQGGATGSALDGAGHVFTVAPNFGANQIKRYDAVGNLLNSFTAAVGGNWIEDMAMGAGNTIWAGTYEGNIFKIDATTGATISSFNVANSSFTGVAFDGTNLWATEGVNGSDAIYKYDALGNPISTIHTGQMNGGLGYDRDTNTLWAGGWGIVSQFDLSGNWLSSFNTGSSNYHDGLEIGNVSNNVPDGGTTAVLLGSALLGLAALRRRFSRA